MTSIDRRDFLKLAGLAGVTFVSGIGCSTTQYEFFGGQFD